MFFTNGVQPPPPPPPPSPPGSNISEVSLMKENERSMFNSDWWRHQRKEKSNLQKASLHICHPLSCKCLVSFCSIPSLSQLNREASSFTQILQVVSCFFRRTDVSCFFLYYSIIFFCCKGFLFAEEAAGTKPPEVLWKLILTSSERDRVKRRTSEHTEHGALMKNISVQKESRVCIKSEAGDVRQLVYFHSKTTR